MTEEKIILGYMIFKSKVCLGKAQLFLTLRAEISFLIKRIFGTLLTNFLKFLDWFLTISELYRSAMSNSFTDGILPKFNSVREKESPRNCPLLLFITILLFNTIYYSIKLFWKYWASELGVRSGEHMKYNSPQQMQKYKTTGQNSLLNCVDVTPLSI